MAEEMNGFYLGNGVTVFKLPSNHGYIVTRPGDMMYNTPEQAEVAARSGSDLDQKIGCHLAWQHPTVPDDIKARMKERWDTTPPAYVEAEPQDDTDHQFYTLRREQEQEKLFKRIKATSENDLCALVFYLSFDAKNVQQMHAALDQLEKLHG